MAGASRALRKRPDAAVPFYGDEKIGRRRDRAPRATSDRQCQVLHSPEVDRTPSEKPSQAIRRARTTSMGMAINAVKEGKADAALSGRQHRRDDGDGQAGAADHAGDRPARRSPRCCRRSARPTCVMLDLGANTECDAQNLVQFAVMGSAYARTVLGISTSRA